MCDKLFIYGPPPALRRNEPDEKNDVPGRNWEERKTSDLTLNAALKF
jgi:hypothetical protein